MKFDSVSITFGGKTFAFDDVAKVSWKPAPGARYGSPKAPPFYEASVTCEMPAGTFERLLDAVFGKVKARKRWIDPTPPIEPWRCPLATLMRRAGYGGRKGRSALRRALARPDAEWQAWSSRAP